MDFNDDYDGDGFDREPSLQEQIKSLRSSNEFLRGEIKELNERITFINEQMKATIKGEIERVGITFGLLWAILLWVLWVRS